MPGTDLGPGHEEATKTDLRPALVKLTLYCKRQKEIRRQIAKQVWGKVEQVVEEPNTAGLEKMVGTNPCPSFGVTGRSLIWFHLQREAISFK